MEEPSGSDQLRAGHQDRESACDDLGRHYAAGRLTMAELEDRQGAAWTARTIGDLRALFGDLPPLDPGRLPATTSPVPLPTSYPGPPSHPGPASHPAQWSAPGAPAWPPPAWAGPLAPHGYDPLSGRPYSDKEKVTAGVLQIFLGSLGVGRFYTGSTGVGLVQLLLTVCSLGILLPVTAIWGLVDGIIMLTGSPTDSHGRPLR